MGTVHGGRILNLIDSLAGVVAARHSDGPAVTATIDETAFLRAVRVGDVVHVDARCSTGPTRSETCKSGWSGSTRGAGSCCKIMATANLRQY
ncbi:acyl-CoA thioesterase [Micromonospora orduensis]|uniref:acyl-CoA thioesterase n=1 Tax=Micromonospora orduensis TaxID=1420891 RepID=UPI001FCA924D|nr:acyl-CoA thioesterase [Micromonospora orduensis]